MIPLSFQNASNVFLLQHCIMHSYTVPCCWGCTARCCFQTDDGF